MNPDTRRTLHLGINFVFAPAPRLGTQPFIDFQQELDDLGLEFDNISRSESAFELARSEPSQLNVKIARVQQDQLGQLLIVAPQPTMDSEVFRREAEDLCEAYDRVWEGARQIVQRDVTIRHLYDSAGEHAFGYLWENRFGQPEADLDRLGRPVLGGGLRLVMPPAEDHEPATVEVKIESYLRDSRKIFIETQFTWQEPSAPGSQFDPREPLTEVEEFATHDVVDFILNA